VWFISVVYLEGFTPAVCNMHRYKGLNRAEKDVLTESLCTKSMLLFRQNIKGCTIKLHYKQKLYCKYANFLWQRSETLNKLIFIMHSQI
jgi:hypothetical protein